MNVSNRRPLITAVIPARMASSRYPGKPLALILDLPMIEHVRRRTLLAKGVDHVIVATCDQSIRLAVEAAGGIAVMTKDTHDRCTDRIEEAMQHLPGDVVVMVQGDEPLLLPNVLQMVAQPLLDDSSLDIVNLLSPLESDADYLNPNIVKAVLNLRGEVMHLTRAAVPFFRERVPVPVFRQTGIMAFRASFLHRFSKMAETPLERAESIDMLRALENGVRIFGVVVNYVTIGVDRPADVPLVEAVLRNDAIQLEIYERTKLIRGVQ